MIDDDFDFDQPVQRIPQHVEVNKLGHQVLREAEDYLHSLNEGEYLHLIEILRQLAQQESYFSVLADNLEFSEDPKIANDVLNLVHFYQLMDQEKIELNSENLLDLINQAYFQEECLAALDQMELDENTKTQRCVVIQEAFKLYQMKCFAGCTTLLYAQLEGLLTDVLLEKGYLKQNQTKFVDVYKVVPGLKAHEIKSLWHKVKIACEMNGYFLELAAYKMDSSSTVTMTRHNILHGVELNDLTQERSFILFIWLFAALSFMSTLRT